LKKYVIILFLSFFLFSCFPRIPPESVVLSRNIKTGVETLEKNAMTAIDAWQEASLSLVEHQWNKIYTQAEKVYWSKRTKPDNGVPTEDQYSEIAAIATFITKELGDKVRAKAEEMKKTVSENSDVVKDMNLQVTELLSSASRILEMNETLLDSIVDIVPLPIDALKVK
jgi:hypothetical protein